MRGGGPGTGVVAGFDVGVDDAGCGVGQLPVDVQLVGAPFGVERGLVSPRRRIQDSVEEVLYGWFGVVGVDPVEVQVL